MVPKSTYQLPVAAGDVGPWQVRVLVKRGNETLEDRARVVLDLATALGEPLLYRAASPPAAPYVPVADRQFQRNERTRVEWLVSSPTPIRLKARLLQTTGHPLTYALPVVPEERSGSTLARVDMTMTSIAAGDYLIEQTTESNGQKQTTLLAIRVLG